MINIKIFLASSSELAEDRKDFVIFISHLNNSSVNKDMYYKLELWENFLDAISQTRLQDEYNKVIIESEIFVMLFETKVGIYTEEEFETAFKQFKATNRPFIFTYFKDSGNISSSADENDLLSLRLFQEKLEKLGHFYTRYANIHELKYNFTQQLEKLAVNRFTEFPTQKNSETEPIPHVSINSSKNIVTNSTINSGGDFIIGDSSTRN